MSSFFKILSSLNVFLDTCRLLMTITTAAAFATIDRNAITVAILFDNCLAYDFAQMLGVLQNLY